jgi:AcrR family transcriptional regulator
MTPSEVAAARPLRADARRNRERILAAATFAFAAEGVAVQMDAVAHLAGVGVGTLYRHFPTKEALLAELADHEVRRCTAYTERMVAGCDARAALEQFVRQSAEEMARSAGLRQAMTAATAGYCALSRAELRAMLASLISRAHADGGLRHGVTTDDFIALIGGLAATIDLGGDAMRTADILVAGLRS